MVEVCVFVSKTKFPNLANPEISHEMFVFRVTTAKSSLVAKQIRVSSRIPKLRPLETCKMWLPPQRNACFLINQHFTFQRTSWWTLINSTRRRSASGRPPLSTQHIFFGYESSPLLGTQWVYTHATQLLLHPLVDQHQQRMCLLVNTAHGRADGAATYGQISAQKKSE